MCLAIPGEILDTYEKEGVRYAEVSFAGMKREVCLHVQPNAVAGEFVLVHVGLAIARIDAEEARRTWELLTELGADPEEAIG